MENPKLIRLVGSEIHGFHTMEDLDIGNMMEEAKGRWLRPNEIHAILCNHKHFTVYVKPVNLPKSGTIVLFDRKMLRNFRKDGHNWKKKKDGKTVKEAHEHLKVGNEERIHVYYAHGEDNSTFVRRCYWLLDKTMEHIVLVHYRETQEMQGSPVTPGNSNSSSALSDPTPPWVLSDETDSVVDQACYTSAKPHIAEANDTIKSHAMTLHAINTLEWDELVVPNDPSKRILAEGGNVTFLDEQNECEINGYRSNVLLGNAASLEGSSALTSTLPAENPSHLPRTHNWSNSMNYSNSNDLYLQALGALNDFNSQNKNPNSVAVGPGNPLDAWEKDGLRTQDSFGRWMNHIMTDSTGLIGDTVTTPDSSISTGQELFRTPLVDHHQSSFPQQIFNITDVSPAWAFSNEETKILVVGFFHEEHQHVSEFNLFCVCGDISVPVEIIQAGVFRCLVSPHNPGLVSLYLSFDGRIPISQLVAFEYRTPTHHNQINSSEDKSKLEEFQFQMRLAHLLFSTSKSLDVWSSKVSPKNLKDAKMFARKTSHIIASWEFLIRSIEDNKISFPQAKDSLFELTLQSRLHEWLLESVVGGSKNSDRDEQGQGVIHLCAILGYTWAIYPFSWSGLSLNYRDKFGWTALHWAAYYGREKMVATLLSAGAKPTLVSDPTPDNPGGCTAADLASKNGYDGLAAYLAEKGLVSHFKDMTIAGNVSGPLQSTSSSTEESFGTPLEAYVSEEDLYLRDTLAAYRTAADAAARIQAAFREQSFHMQAKAVQGSNPEDEARSIIAAMKIQHAFRKHETRKQMAAAAHIQYRFRSWKMRKDFLNMRRHTIKIQAVFRGFQVRRQYRKIVWSVGVLEKAILRWRLKRKGFRGLQVNSDEAPERSKQASEVEEEFFHASRKQAEERVERSVVRVQAMFRSKKAQQEYQMMKIAHYEATLEYEGLNNPPVVDMEK